MPIVDVYGEKVEFPDNMTDDEIVAAIKRNYPEPKPTTAQPSPIAATPPQPTGPSILSKIAGLARQGQELLNPQALIEEQGPAIRAGSAMAAPGLHAGLSLLERLGLKQAGTVRRDIGPASVGLAGGVTGFVPSHFMGQLAGNMEAAELSRQGKIGPSLLKRGETLLEPATGLLRPWAEVGTVPAEKAMQVAADLGVPGANEPGAIGYRRQLGAVAREFKKKVAEKPVQTGFELATAPLMILGPALHAKVTGKVKAAGEAVKAMEANPTQKTIDYAKLTNGELRAELDNIIQNTTDPKTQGVLQAYRAQNTIDAQKVENAAKIASESEARWKAKSEEVATLREKTGELPEDEVRFYLIDALREKGSKMKLEEFPTSDLIDYAAYQLPFGERPSWFDPAYKKYTGGSYVPGGGLKVEPKPVEPPPVAPPEAVAPPVVNGLIVKKGMSLSGRYGGYDWSGKVDLMEPNQSGMPGDINRGAITIKLDKPLIGPYGSEIPRTDLRLQAQVTKDGWKIVDDRLDPTNRVSPAPVEPAPPSPKPPKPQVAPVAGKTTKGTKTQPVAPAPTANAGFEKLLTPYLDRIEGGKKVLGYVENTINKAIPDETIAGEAIGTVYQRLTNAIHNTAFQPELLEGLVKKATANAIASGLKKMKLRGREVPVEELGGEEAVEGGIIERVRGGKRPIVGEMLGAELEQPGITGSKAIEPPKSTPGIETAKAEWLHNQEGTAYAHSTNLNNMSLPETAWDDFLNIHNQFDQAFEANKIHRSLAEIKEQAKDIGMDEHFLNQWEGTTKDLDILANAAKKLQADIAIDGSAKLQDPNLSHADKAMLVQRMANAFIKVDDMSSNYGRALSSLRNKFGEGEAVKSYMQAIIEQAKREGQYKGEKVLPKEVVDQIVSMMEDPDFNPSAIIPFTKTPTLWDKAYFCWLNGLVSAPSTHIVNLTSTGIMSTLELPVRAVAEGTAWFGSKAGSHVGPAALARGEFVAEMIGRARGTMEAAKSMGKAVPSGLEYFGGMASKYEQGIHPIKGWKGKVVGLPTEALAREDMLFKSTAYYGELSALAYRKAIGEGLKPLSKEAFARMEEHFQRPTVDMVKAASDRALDVTFNSPVPKGIIKQLMAVRQQPTLAGKAAGIIFPFIRTPWNIAFKGIEYSPVNFGRILARQMGWMGEGKLTPAEYHMTMARAMVGTGIQLAVYQLAKQGLITGSGPTEKNKREALYRTGWQPYSVKIGDKYVSYFRLEPFGTILGLAADFTELTQDMDEDKKNYVFDKIAMSIGRNLSSKTFLQGISNVVNVITDPTRYGENWIEQLAGSAVPATGAMNWASRTIDPNLREVHGILDAIKYRIPGVSKTLPARQDIWGEEIKKEGITKGIGGDIWRAVSPVQVSTAKENEVETELSRLGYFPGKPSKNVGKEKLTPKQYYDLIKNSGPQAKQSILDKIRSPEYQNLSDSQKRNKLESIISETRTVAREPYLTDEGLTPSEIFERKKRMSRSGIRTMVGK